jgi:hypothetical protein
MKWMTEDCNLQGRMRAIIEQYDFNARCGVSSQCIVMVLTFGPSERKWGKKLKESKFDKYKLLIRVSLWQNQRNERGKMAKRRFSSTASFRLQEREWSSSREGE